MLLSLCLNVTSKSYVVIPIDFFSPLPAAASPIPLDIITSLGSAQFLDAYLFIQEA